MSAVIQVSVSMALACVDFVCIAWLLPVLTSRVHVSNVCKAFTRVTLKGVWSLRVWH